VANPKNTPSLFVSGDISEETILRILAFLYGNKSKPVQVFISSNGGDVISGLEIYKLFKQHGKVTCIAVGYCNSIATIVMLGAAKKLATKGTEFLIHFGSVKAGSILERKIIDKLHEETVEIYKKELKGATDELLNWYFTADIYLDFDKALELGLVNGEYKL